MVSARRQGWKDHEQLPIANRLTTTRPAGTRPEQRPACPAVFAEAGRQDAIAGVGQAARTADQILAYARPRSTRSSPRIDTSMTRLGQETSGQTGSPQPVTAGVTRAAIFLVVTVNAGSEHEPVVRGLCGDLAALLRAVGARGPDGRLSCVMAVGSEAWDRLFGVPKPKDLHPFREIRGQHHAVASPGDILFHIRSARMDLCFELATEIMSRLGGAVSAVDEVHGFSYFDARDLIGFVDGTENPVGQAAADATIIGAEDPIFGGGSYVIVQKYLHDLRRWNELPVEQQERIIGRTKLSDVELSDAVKPTSAHNALTTIIEDGRQVEILRDNMAFGDAGTGEFGTYFIGYARTPRPIEQMLVNMFVGRPPGNYDRLLDFSRAVTGTLFFVPSATFLECVAGGVGARSSPDPAHTGSASTSRRSLPDGSLGIGSLKDKAGHD
jgi:putative iron-dependent peroxidase